MATRREFIEKGSLATLVGLTSGFGFNKNVFGFKADLSFSKNIDSIHNFDQNFMKSYLNTVFDVTDNNRQFAKLKLIEISKFEFNKAGSKKSKFDNFSMIFKGIKGNQLKQAVYEFKHSQMVSFSVLLVPITIDKNYYEVVINKLSG